LEIEIKLLVPADRVEALQRGLFGRARHVTETLQARYFDTVDRRLAARQAAVRVRREGERWVQTLKALAKGVGRIEVNVEVPGPELDLSRFEGTEAGTWLARELRNRDTLVCVYETDIVRLRRQARRGAARVELALDRGSIRSGALSLPVCELELELADGEPVTLPRWAAELVARHGLLLDPRTKAERGDALAQARQAIDQGVAQGVALSRLRDEQIRRFWAPVKASRVKLHPEARTADAFEAFTLNCLGQVLRNALIMADADGAGQYQSEHLHQLRVGIRRMRSAWKLLQGWVPDVPEPLVSLTREIFRQSGQWRDADVLSGDVRPLLEKAGMPPLPAPPTAADTLPNVADWARSSTFQAWACQVLEHALWVGSEKPALPLESPLGELPAQVLDDSPWLPELVKRLRRWHRRLCEDGARLPQLTETERHGLRKRVKRHRYALDLSASLLHSDERLQTYRRLLAQLQEHLGTVNDLALARQHYVQLAASQPPAWFAVGWASARIDDETQQAQAVIAQLARAEKAIRLAR
jgi:inorganic triphosphatase YgiF